MGHIIFSYNSRLVGYTRRIKKERPKRLGYNISRPSHRSTDYVWWLCYWDVVDQPVSLCSSDSSCSHGYLVFGYRLFSPGYWSIRQVQVQCFDVRIAMDFIYICTCSNHERFASQISYSDISAKCGSLNIWVSCRFYRNFISYTAQNYCVSKNIARRSPSLDGCFSVFVWFFQFIIIIFLLSFSGFSSSFYLSFFCSLIFSFTCLSFQWKNKSIKRKYSFFVVVVLFFCFFLLFFLKISLFFIRIHFLHLLLSNFFIMLFIVLFVNQVLPVPCLSVCFSQLFCYQ